MEPGNLQPEIILLVRKRKCLEAFANEHPDGFSQTSECGATTETVKACIAGLPLRIAEICIPGVFFFL
jgi:hypothetical protein